MNTIGSTNENVNDERGGLPSASGLERIALCPGSWQLERQCPREESSEAADSGSRIHAFLAHEAVDLSQDELDVAIKCMRQANDLIGAGEELREQRLWYSDKFGRRLFSGQADVLVISGNTALVIDYKTGRGEVSASAANFQLRGLAVLVKHNYPDVEVVSVAIIQPLASSVPVVCEYGPEELDLAKLQILNVVGLSEVTDPPLVPSEAACKYCRAKAICPALRKTITTPQVADGGDAKAVMAASSAALAPVELGELVAHKVPLARMLCDALEKEAFSRLCQDPESVPGLALDTETPRVSDSVKLWERVWLQANDKLTPAGRAKSGAGAEAKAASESAFSDLVEIKLIERRSWTDQSKAAETLQAALSPEQYREVAGKIIINK